MDPTNPLSPSSNSPPLSKKEKKTETMLENFVRNSLRDIAESKEAPIPLDSTGIKLQVNALKDILTKNKSLIPLFLEKMLTVIETFLLELNGPATSRNSTPSSTTITSTNSRSSHSSTSSQEPVLSEADAEPMTTTPTLESNPHSLSKRAQEKHEAHIERVVKSSFEDVVNSRSTLSQEGEEMQINALTTSISADPILSKSFIKRMLDFIRQFLQQFNRTSNPTPIDVFETIHTNSTAQSTEALLIEIKQMQIISPKSYVNFMKKIKKLHLSDANKFLVVTKLNKKAFDPEYFDLRLKSKLANKQFIKEISQIKDPILYKLYFDILEMQITASEKTVFNSIPFEIASLQLFFKPSDQPKFITLFKKISTYDKANGKDFIGFYNQIIAIEPKECRKILMDRLATIFYRAPFSSLANSELQADTTALEDIPELAYMHQKYSDEFKLRR
jgi:hypothetical protein